MAKILAKAVRWEEEPDGTIFEGFGAEIESVRGDDPTRAAKRNGHCRGYVADGQDWRLVFQRGAAATAPLSAGEKVAAFGVGVAAAGEKSSVFIRHRAEAGVVASTDPALDEVSP